MAGAVPERDRAAHGGLPRLYGGPHEGGGAGRRRSPPAGGCRNDRAGQQQQDQRAERTLCRNARAARGILPHRGRRSRCGVVLGGALPRRQPRRGRSAADLDDVTPPAISMIGHEGDRNARDAAEQTARQSYGKLVAFLAHRLRDVSAAEDALAEAFSAALADWPLRGVPEKPEAWLLTVARRKGIDAERRRRNSNAAAGDLQLLTEELAESTADANEAVIPDHRLALIFACAHPAIEARIRAPLMLQTVLGFDAATIASAFLVAPAAMAQRLVRAKTKI